MSIISDALRKVSDNRKEVTALRQELPKEKTSHSINREAKDVASKKIKWNTLSGIGTLFIIGVAIVAFLYNADSRPSILRSRNFQTREQLREYTTRPAAQSENIEVAIEKPVIIKTSLPLTNTRPLISKSTIKPALREEKPKPVYFDLSGVIEGSGEPLAIINGSILGKGDTIERAEVVDITPHRVLLRRSGEDIYLRIK